MLLFPLEIYYTLHFLDFYLDSFCRQLEQKLIQFVPWNEVWRY